MSPRKYTKYPSKRDQSRVRVARGTVHVVDGKSYVVRGFKSTKRSVMVVVETDDGEMEEIPTAEFLTQVAPGDPARGALQRFDERNTKFYELLTPAQQAYVDDWVGHLSEVEYGDKQATSPEPRPGVDPDALDDRYDLSKPITERRRSKSAELKLAEYTGASVASLSEKARHVLHGGPRGIGILFDAREGAELMSIAELPDKVMEIAKAVTLEHQQDYAGTMDGVTRDADLAARLFHAGLSSTVSPRGRKLLLDRAAAGLGLHLPASTRESQKGRPGPGYGSQSAQRPGEIIQLDCTPLNAFCVSDGEFIAVDILTAIDVYTRMVVAVRVVGGTHTAQDVNLLLYDALSSRFRREHWNPEPKDPFLGAPDAVSIPPDETFLIPGTVKVVTDRGRQFDNKDTRMLLRELGIQVYTTPPGGGWAKGLIESFQRYYARLFQGIQGDKGASSRDRPKAAGKRVVGPSRAIAERMIIEFVTLEYHLAKHRGLTEDGKKNSPMSKFEDYVLTYGEIYALVEPDFIYRFLEHERRYVWDDGIHIRGRVYDGPALRGLQVSKRGRLGTKVQVRFDRRDRSRVHVLHPTTGDYVEVPLAAKTRRVVRVGAETIERTLGEDRPRLVLTDEQRLVRRGTNRADAKAAIDRETATQRERRQAAAREPIPRPPMTADEESVINLDERRTRDATRTSAEPKKPYAPSRRLSW